MSDFFPAREPAIEDFYPPELAVSVVVSQVARGLKYRDLQPLPEVMKIVGRINDGLGAQEQLMLLLAFCWEALTTAGTLDVKAALGRRV